MKFYEFTEVFGLAALQAGCVARRLQGQTEQMTKPDKATPEGAALTLADLISQDVILRSLWANFPDAAVDAEEDTETKKFFPPEAPDRPLIVVDPIDGTLSYAMGTPDYAVMGAWLTEGIFRSALVYYPAYDKTYAAWEGEGAWLLREGKPFTRLEPSAKTGRILITPRATEPLHEALRKAGYDPVTSRCSGSDGVTPARGEACASIALAPLTRSRALALFIAREAGAHVIAGDEAWRGQDPAEDAEKMRPVVTAANKQLAKDIMAVTMEFFEK